MPAKLSTIPERITNRALEIGAQIRIHRKKLGVSATTASESAGMSRVTWYRIEKGMTSITTGALLSALSVLGLELTILHPSDQQCNRDNALNSAEMIPVRITLADYPQLKLLAWHVHGVESLSPREALDIYERNRRHLDFDKMEQHERHLLTALQRFFIGDKRNV